MAQEGDRIRMLAGLQMGLTEAEIWRRMLRDNLRRRIDMLLATDGIFGHSPFDQLRVTLGAIPATQVVVAAGDAYLAGDYMRVAAPTTLTKGAGLVTHYVKLRAAQHQREPGSITVTGGAGTVVGIGTTFTRYNVQDKIRTQTGGANDAVVRSVTAIVDDLNMTVSPNWAVNEGPLTDWRYAGYFAPGYTDSQFVFEYEAVDAGILVFDTVAPIPGTDLALATVSVDPFTGNIESIADTRSTNLATLMALASGAAITDTYSIYADNTVQNHVDAVGAYAAAAGWVTATNPHGVSAGDVRVSDVTQNALLRYDWLGAAAGTTLDAFLSELVQEFRIADFLPATALRPDGVNATWATVSGIMVIEFANAGGVAQLGFKLPHRSVIDWTALAPPYFDLLVFGDGASGAAATAFDVRVYWTRDGQTVAGDTAVAVAVTANLPAAPSLAIVRAPQVLGWNFANLDTAFGYAVMTITRQAGDAYAGPVRLVGVGFRGA